MEFLQVGCCSSAGDGVPGAGGLSWGRGKSPKTWGGEMVFFPMNGYPHNLRSRL
jgi:hypothetical protein